ncbi:IS630 family transposase [Nostoc sp.]|uniref:IS630 family transposase n=1 Tax=Nostoc sp. TaxID=1180 RepID=UPI002FF656C5
MNKFLLEQQKSKRIAILTEFIHSDPESRELQRVIAVKMALQGEPYSKITKLLGMNKSCITNWKQRFGTEGIDGIKLGYKGAKSYLTPEQHREIMTWLSEKDYCSIDELVSYLDEKYAVIYQSKQSYYELLSSAHISWKRSQKINPSSNPDLVKIKREEIINFLTQNQAEIESGHLVVFLVDECHLLANDVCGYVWGKTDIRIEIPIKNIKDRQTYFGALDYKTQEFIVHEYPSGNSSSTVDFIKHLQNQRPRQRIVLIWDGASYHRSDEVKKFLADVNDRHAADQWPITCIRFAPNAPEQNPVEDVWLQTKNFLRKFWPLCKSFPVVKWLFKFFTNHQEFDFPKLHQYAPCSDLK